MFKRKETKPEQNHTSSPQRQLLHMINNEEDEIETLGEKDFIKLVSL